VIGDGTGGRNLETTLRLALLSSTVHRNAEFVGLCAGTDGIDGNSHAAGAVGDSTTMKPAEALEISADEVLQHSGSYSFFTALGDVIATGQTGTNVRDIRILLSSPARL